MLNGLTSYSKSLFFKERNYIRFRLNLTLIDYNKLLLYEQ